MKIKLIDISTNTYETVFGTCDICLSTGIAEEQTFIFDIGGEIRQVDGFYWSYGDLFTTWIENTADFAYWLSQPEFPEDFVLEGYSDLQDLVYEYDDWCLTEEDEE